NGCRVSRTRGRTLLGRRRSPNSEEGHQERRLGALVPPRDRMARHIFKPSEWAYSAIKSVSLCGECYSTREARAATGQQVVRAPACGECMRRERIARRRGSNNASTNG